MRDNRKPQPPLWTRDRIFELGGMLMLFGGEMIYFLLMIFTEAGTTWGAMGVAAILGVCFAPLQLAWLVWFVVRLVSAAQRSPG